MGMKLIGCGVTDSTEEPRRLQGHVKWFDPAKGFGFVVADEGGPDILLHANVLRNFGQSSIADGARVEITAQQTARGMQAVSVIDIKPPEGTGPASLADFEGLDPDELRAAPLEPARVKWFDAAKGFGFANVFGRGEDVFVHIEVLRRSGLADLQPGEALAVRVIKGKRGWMATEVSAWEAALSDNR
jgi:CspA family cold shock protein